MEERKIQDYILGVLPPAEAEEVAAAIANDPELQRLARDYGTMFRSMKRERTEILTQELATFEESLPDPGDAADGGGRPPRKPWWWVGGAVILMLLLSLILWPGASDFSSVGDEYFADPYNPLVAGNTDDNADVLTAAYLAYHRDGDYGRAEELFTSLINDERYGSEAIFYLPHCSYRLGEHVRASASFSRALNIEGWEAERNELLRWNAMINKLVRGEDIEDELSSMAWSPYLNAEKLREALVTQ